MTNTTALAKRPLEMTWSTGGDAEAANALEGAMAAAIFERLQKAGLIDPKATLDSKIPSGDLEGEKYSDALRALIGDQDGDQRLDLDIYELGFSGILNPSVRPDSVEAAVANEYLPAISDSFLMKHGIKSEFGINDRGREKSELVKGMYLEDAVGVKNAAFLESAGSRISAGEGDRVTGEALAKAQMQTNRGRDGEARKLLLATGDALLDAGDTKNAKRIFEELRREPHGKAEVNAAQAFLDPILAKGEKLAWNEGPSLSTEHMRMTVDMKSHETTYGAIADRRLTQLAFKEKMTATLGRDADPYKQEDAQAYFEKFAKNRSTAEVRDELGSYLSSHFAHGGDAVSWHGIPEDDRSKQIDELFTDLPKDAAGRKLIDCEGFSYLTGGLLDEKRFDVNYLQRPGHIISAVVDKKTNDVFTVNNSQTREVPGKTREGQVTKEQLEKIALEAGTTPGSHFGYAKTPSTAYMSQSDGAPRLGTYGLGKDGKIAGRFNEHHIEMVREQRAKLQH